MATETKSAPEVKALEYGPDSPVKRAFIIPNPGVTINGKVWLGRRDLTYDEKSNVQAMLSARSQHEIRARLGESEAKKIIDLGVLSSEGVRAVDF